MRGRLTVADGRDESEEDGNVEEVRDDGGARAGARTGDRARRLVVHAESRQRPSAPTRAATSTSPTARRSAGWAPASSGGKRTSHTRRSSSKATTATSISVDDSNVTSFMANAIIGIPVGGQRGGGFRPYFVGRHRRAAARTCRAPTTLFTINNNEFGFNLGSGRDGLRDRSRRLPRRRPLHPLVRAIRSRTTSSTSTSASFDLLARHGGRHVPLVAGRPFESSFGRLVRIRSQHRRDPLLGRASRDVQRMADRPLAPGQFGPLRHGQSVDSSPPAHAPGATRPTACQRLGLFQHSLAAMLYCAVSGARRFHRLDGPRRWHARAGIATTI